MELTASEIGERLARADGLPREDVAYFTRQIRNWTNLGFLLPVGRQGRGPKAASVFPQEAIFRARIFATLTELGFDATRIRQISADLARGASGPFDELPPSFNVGGAYASSNVIVDALRGISAGERCRYEIRLVVDADGTKSLESGPTWPDYPQDTQDFGVRELARQAGLSGFKPPRRVLCTVTLDLNALFAPLMEVDAPDLQSTAARVVLQREGLSD